MSTVAGPVVRVEPAQAAGIPDTFTPLAEVTAPTSAAYLVATITASALSGSEPAMGTVRMWNRTFNSWAQARIYGTQTVTMKMVTVSAGDLIQIAASPYFYAGEWESSRVWVHRASVLLVEYEDIPATASTYAPGKPPTQTAVSAGATGTTVLSYSWGEAWGPYPLSTSWRFRPVGGDTWEVLQASNAGTVVLPFTLDDHDWEVQGAQTTVGGLSPWGETVVWTFTDLGAGGSTPPSAEGFGLSPFGVSPFGIVP